MPAAPAELRRGRIFYGLFPFVARFPLELLDGGTAPTVEDYAAARRGGTTRIIAEARLRPVLLLHDGTRGAHEDVICLRINTVKGRHVRDSGTWQRIQAQEHPFFFHLPTTGRYGLPEESVVALTSIGAVHKSAILGRRHVGELTVREMQVVSERLRVVLSLDLASQIASQARELLRRAGIEL